MSLYGALPRICSHCLSLRQPLCIFSVMLVMLCMPYNPNTSTRMYSSKGNGFSLDRSPFSAPPPCSPFYLALLFTLQIRSVFPFLTGCSRCSRHWIMTIGSGLRLIFLGACTANNRSLLRLIIQSRCHLPSNPCRSHVGNLPRDQAVMSYVPHMIQ
ncbi:hypothetical protein PILCRDRAFT_515136 [Piloderma croceum F 1598]|uniref:Uncharacterized protein n=1 Tax=Piloderma croceum (strain F 1598) TaxID=765440 RepID=A0A0C3B3I6_PILCF|nr:hypothetical protein PILCRDRAFT_515136 [Piloderma croceum F 1598]